MRLNNGEDREISLGSNAVESVGMVVNYRSYKTISYVITDGQSHCLPVKVALSLEFCLSVIRLC